MMQWNSGFGGIWMFLWWLIIISLVVGVAYMLINGGHRIPNDGRVISRSPQNAMEILKERYAKGEITEEEFIKMRKNLRDD
jgi:putative membrane protein